MIGQRLETHGYTMGDNNWGRIECVTRLLDCATDTMVIMDSSHVIMPFRGGDTLRVALAGHHSEWYNEDHWWINWIKTYAVGLGASAPLFQFGLRVAQSDADGMRRLILGSSALDANDYTELWHNDVMAEPTAAFRPCAGCDEILLSYHNQLHAFFVYDAATGLLIDNTSGIEGGSPRYVLPVPGRADALVTFVDSTRTARIYRLGAPPAPNRLTCLKVPGSEMLRLLWEPVPLVDRYCVFAAEESEGEGSLIADVPASQHSIEISPDQDRQFFTVRAIRD